MCLLCFCHLFKGLFPLLFFYLAWYFRLPVSEKVKSRWCIKETSLPGQSRKALADCVDAINWVLVHHNCSKFLIELKWVVSLMKYSLFFFNYYSFDNEQVLNEYWFVHLTGSSIVKSSCSCYALPHFKTLSSLSAWEVVEVSILYLIDIINSYWRWGITAVT